MRELTIFSRKLKKCLALTLAALVAVSGIPLTFSFRTEAAVEGKGTGDDPYIGHIYFASPSDVETPLYSVANTDKLTLVYNPPVKPKKTPALNSVFLVNSTDPSKSFYMWSGKAATKNNRVEIAFDGLYQAAFDPDWQPYKGALVPGGTYYIECWDDDNVNAYGDQSVCSRSQSVVTVAGEGGDEEAAWAEATLVPDNKDTGAENVTYTLNLKPDRSFTVEAGESGFSLVLPDADFSDAAVTSDLVSGTPGKWGHSMQFEFKAGSTVTESDGISIVLSGVRNPDETTSHPVISGFVAEGGDDGRVVFEETKLDTLRYREAATLKSVYACVTTDLAGSSKAPVISMRADGSGNADSVTAVLEYEDKEKITQKTPALSLEETEIAGRYKYNYPINENDEMKDITLKSVEFTLRAGDKTLTKTYSFGS
ncbi:MAG: hypothetical protein IJT00_01885, partial [Lachnospiraceae bacterium]|nr:hypothetical protein [Lachnospiraceae bacterium]